jgi:hypothetical protein
MPSYEVRYLNNEGELALIHKTRQESDDAVDRAAYRMLLGSGFAHYEIWREEESRCERDDHARHRMLKTTLRAG